MLPHRDDGLGPFRGIVNGLVALVLIAAIMAGVWLGAALVVEVLR